MPEETWKHLSPEFFVLFWSLQLNDLAFPQESYIAENNRLKKAAEEVMRVKNDTSRSSADKGQQRKELLARQKNLNDEHKRDLERWHKARIALTKQAANNVWLNGNMGPVQRHLRRHTGKMYSSPHAPLCPGRRVLLQDDQVPQRLHIAPQLQAHVVL